MVPAVSPVAPASPPQPELLLVDSAADAGTYRRILRGTYRVASTSVIEIAKQFLRRNPPSLVVTELNLPGGSGADICREAKSLTPPPVVLVTASNTENVPDALVAGCDAVLLKPFPPNLLFARLGRLLRARNEARRVRPQHQQLKAAQLHQRPDSLLEGTNRVWPSTHCPYCDRTGVTSFEFCSHRRAWYACLACKNVWIAKRQE